MFDILLWYLFLVLLGWIAFPIAFNFLSNLHDKGYAFARILALLLWGFFYWILNIFGLSFNSQSGAFFTLLILIFIGQYYFRKNKKSLIAWLKKDKKYLLTVEILFFISFVFCVALRTTNPQILGTEKPMELAFINAILRSPSFPPNDPWLSGYAISYYYFGYILIALIANLLQTSGGTAFNLAISLWFALTSIASYGLLYNLLQSWIQNNSAGNHSKVKDKIRKRILFLCLLAPLFILIISNAEGFLEMLHAHDLFWSTNRNSEKVSIFWNWLDIQELSESPHEPYTWVPKRIGGTWWWRASRVLQDYNLNGDPKEIIDEFPFFSFLLADLHPHVLAIPFVMLVIGLSFNLFISSKRLSFEKIRVKKILCNSQYWIISLILGSIAFINTWDFPIYFSLFLLTLLVKIVQQEGLSRKIIFNFVKVSLLIGLGSVFLYLPFYLGFSSQAGGIVPSMNYFTRGVYFWVMFLPFLVPILAYLIWLNNKWCKKEIIWKGLKFSFLIVVSIGVISYSFAWFVGYYPQLLMSLQGITGRWMQNCIISSSSNANTFLAMHGGLGIQDLIYESLLNRIYHPATIITTLILLALSMAIFLSNVSGKGLRIEFKHSFNNKNIFDKNVHIFVGLLILMGIVLTLFPEFFYLRDVFGWRMNTIFKFYFQTWILWGLAASFAVVVLWVELPRVMGTLFRIIIFMVCLICLAYPIFTLLDRAQGFYPHKWILDGTSYLSASNIDELSAVDSLKDAPYGVIAEAVGGSYSGFARISTLTGLPTVLGWPGHEIQWRGGADEIGSRESDIERLYTTQKWATASAIIEEYKIKYVYIGDLERMKYHINEVKFKENLDLVFENTSVRIYSTSRVCER